MNEKSRTYRLFLLGILALALSFLLYCVLAITNPDRWFDDKQYLFAPLLTIPPVLIIGYALARAIGIALHEMDELQQRIQLEAYSFSLAGTVILSLAFGLLQFLTELYINLALVAFMVALFWGFGFVFAKRNYQ
jgi:hypothetical protein